MLHMLKTILVIPVLMSAFVLPLAVPQLVTANSLSESRDAACDGIGLTTGTDCGGVSENKIYKFLGTIVNILSVIVGAVAVIMVIIAGFKYITSNGDSNNIASAKNTLIYAVVGLIVVALAQGIVKFVLKVST